MEQRSNADLSKYYDKINALKTEMGKVIIGQEYLIERLIMGIISNGHVLIEGLPGLAKTLSVKTLSDALDMQFSRIQFTPDLLPADVTGTQIYNPKNAEFTVRKGPVFANIVLADEINRAPAKVQSALLESMQEKQVTIGNETFKLPRPFFVIATENPIEQEGTYTLPEAQTDRFMMKLKVEYPSYDEEKLIIKNQAVTSGEIKVNKVLNSDDIFELRKIVENIYTDEKITDYVLNLVFATREPEKYNLDIKDYLRYGASPRASIALILISKAIAFLKGRDFVTPQDVKEIAKDVLRHRLIISYEAEAQEMTSDDIIETILQTIPVP